MATIQKFEDIEAWKLSRELCYSLYNLYLTTDLKTDYKLWNQLNGSSGSIMDNIAEGFGRDGNREFSQFLSVSKSSADETKSQLYRAMDRNYLSEAEFNDFAKKIELIKNKIGALMYYLRNTKMSGIKYKKP